MWIESTIAMRFLRQGRAQTLLILVGIALTFGTAVTLVGAAWTMKFAMRNPAIRRQP